MTSLERTIISRTAYQYGKGTDKYKHVSGLTRAEREAARAGRIVVFRSEYLSGGTHGTPWRIAVPTCRGFVPRVPSAEIVAYLDT